MDNQQERLALTAYLAGIIDGEGWIGLSKHNGRRTVDGYQLQPIISVHMVGIEAIDYIAWIIDRLGLLSNVNHWKASLKRKPSSRLSIAAAPRCKALLEAVRPYLFVKRQQADLLLEFIESREHRIYGSGLTEREKQIREEICALNTKGKNPQRLYAEHV